MAQDFSDYRRGEQDAREDHSSLRGYSPEYRGERSDDWHAGYDAAFDKLENA